MGPHKTDENTTVLFYTPSAKDMKIIFENYLGELRNDKKKELAAKLKSEKYSRFNSSLYHPFSIDFKI